MEAKSIDADAIFKVFTACPNDPKTLILDVRPHKEFKKQHINQAYCVRVSSNRQVLADYSQSSYSLPWSQHCWWGKPVIVYGPAGVNKDHNVVKFLTTEGRCTSVQYYKPGFEAFEARYPYLCTSSVKASSIKKYPSMVLPGFLYLGDWNDAQAHDRLKEMGIKRIVTIHNHPERLSVLLGARHLKLELADVEGADISPYFNEVYEFLADAEQRKQPTLVHCGAGVSRSACLVMMYLMRSRLWSAQKARDHCIAARSLVCPNDGFWRVLCALEGPLGILDRSDPEATMGFAGADAPPTPQLDKQAAGLPVTVKMVTAAELNKQQQQEEAAKAAAAAEEDRRRQEAEAAAAAAAADQRKQEAAAAAAKRDEQQKHVAAVDGAESQQKPRLKRGRSPSPSDTSSDSTSTSSSSSGSSSSTSSSTSDTSSSSSRGTSSGDSEAARARSRSVDRNKPRHRSPSLDRSAAAARRESFEKRSAGKDSRGSKRHHSSRSRSRSTGRVQLRRGGGNEAKHRSSHSRSTSVERAACGGSSRKSDRDRDRSRDRSSGRGNVSDRIRDRPADREGDKHRERNSDRDDDKGRGRATTRGRDRNGDRDRGGRRHGQSRSRDRHQNRGDRRQHKGNRDGLDDGRDAAAAAAGDGGRSDRSRRRDRSSSRDRQQQQQQQQQSALGRSSSRENGHTRSQQPLHFPPPPVAAATGVGSKLPAAAAAAATAVPAERTIQSGWLVTLEVTKPEGLVGRLVLGPMNLHQRVVIGRAPSCNVVLEHLSVSRQHAQLYVDLAGSVHVMDMGAAHGTKLNDTWIKAQQPKAVPVGSQLRFGASTRVYTVLSVEKV